MYVVIELKWHQYIIKENDEIVVDKVDADEWKDITLENILLSFDEKWENVSLGTPYLKWNVVCEIVKQQKWDKVRVVKFKRKNRYERNIGFRAHQTVLKIKKITLNG